MLNIHAFVQPNVDEVNFCQRNADNDDDNNDNNNNDNEQKKKKEKKENDDHDVDDADDDDDDDLKTICVYSDSAMITTIITMFSLK